MSSMWTTKQASSDTGAPGTIPLDQQFAVLLLFGKNSFGDKIYSYVKINIPNLQKLKIAILTGQGFNPSDFGEVVAAGKGEPTPEVRAEVGMLYPVMDGQPVMAAGAGKNYAPPQAANAPVAPVEKKAWDEY